MLAVEATLPPLPYEYNALEPFISAEIMTLHHSKHHQTYINNLNAAIEQARRFPMIANTVTKAEL